MAVGRRKEFDDTAVVRAARDAFWERGYASTSLADLEAVTGLSRSSIYQAYGSKRGLFDRAVTNYCDEFIWPIIEPMEADGAGRAEIVGYFLALAHHLRESPHSVAARGCLIANTASELNVLDDGAARIVRDYRERVQAAIAHALANDSVVESDSRAEVLTAAQMGLMITARFDPLPAAKMAETIAADVATW